MVLHGFELEVKPTTEKNQLGFLSFGSSQYFNGRKHWKSVEKIERGFRRIHYSWRNCEKHAISWNMFRIQQFQFENLQLHQFGDKNGFQDSKDPVSNFL